MIDLLLKQGADINACDSEGKTPLHYAALYNTTDIADFLVSHGADPGIKDKTGRLPLDCAVFSNVRLFLKSLIKKV